MPVSRACLAVATCLACLAVVGPARAQIDPEVLRQRGQMEREQQNAETVRRMRQSAETQEALRRGADPTQLRQLQQEQLNERAAQEALHREQQLRMQSLPPNSTTSPAIEAQRAARERAEQGVVQDRRAPSWGPVLDPPPPRGPQTPGIAQ